MHTNISVVDSMGSRKKNSKCNIGIQENAETSQDGGDADAIQTASSVHQLRSVDLDGRV